MEAELTALATAGATTMVGLMVTESWTHAKQRLVGFLRRRRTDADTEGELQAASDELTGARESGERDDGEAAAAVEAAWRARLLELLAEDPAAATELRTLIAELGDMLPAAAARGGSHYGPDLQGAHIHGGITFNVPPTEPDGSALPDQVPPLTVRFSNRVAELRELSRGLAAAGHSQGRAAVGVDVLDGLPGVGKTALSWHWADSVRDRFPDGQLYVDFTALQGESRGGDVSEALAMLLRSLQVKDDCIPRSLEERAALYRSRSADRRLLLVLDDVTRPAQVRALIPKGTGSAVLATSRRRLAELALDGARLISVKPLDEEGGLALLRDRLGEEAVSAEPAAAARLVSLCDGLPVALQIVSARLLVDEHLTMAELAEELTDEARRLAGLSLDGGHREDGENEEHSVSAVLDSAYRALSPDAARIYRLLGRLPISTFDAGVVAAAARLDTVAARQALGSLVAACLLDRTADRRYHLHRLVRLHAKKRAAQEERPDGEQRDLPSAEERTVTERVARHYLALTAFADRAIRLDRLRIADLSALLARATDPFAAPGGPSPLEWLEAERFAILAVLRAGRRHGLDHLVWPLAEAFTAYFLQRRHLAGWRESLTLGVEAAVASAAVAETAEDVAVAAQAEARLRSLLSRPLMDLGEQERAGAELRTAVARADVTDHLVLRASVQEFLGRCLERTDADQAVTAYRASLDLNLRAGEARGAAIARYFLGSALHTRGEHTQALETLRSARQEFLGLTEPDARMAARAQAAIGQVLARRGDTEDAVSALSEAARTLHDLKATHYEAQALVMLAETVRQEEGGTAEVRAWLSRALEIHEENGSGEAEAVRHRLAELDE
ncbi:NB-ARC domain-containing protein [Streptomyces sp. Da 82-17]|uniref:NB-ARC domain-containing protein n=1 Tax=Streptomyces sp. Da 82-17 TaxID=3377116 RepID=UPI0038D4F646